MRPIDFLATITTIFRQRHFRIENFMKLQGSPSLPTAASIDQPVADSLGSGTFTDPAARPPSRVAADAARHRIANSYRRRGTPDSPLPARLADDDHDPRRGVPGDDEGPAGRRSSRAAADSPGLGVKDSNVPLATQHSGSLAEATSPRAPTPPARSLESLILCLGSERRIVQGTRSSNPGAGFHDTVYLANWFRVFDQHDRLEPAEGATLLRLLADGIADIQPLPRAQEAFGAVMRSLGSLSVADQVGVLQCLTGNLAAARDADGMQAIDALIHGCSGLPEAIRAEVGVELLEKSCNARPAILNHAFIRILREAQRMAPAAARPCIQGLTAALRSLHPDARGVAFELLSDLVFAQPGTSFLEHVPALAAAVDCLEEGREPCVAFVLLQSELVKRSVQDPSIRDSATPIDALLKVLDNLPKNKRMYSLYEILELSAIRSAPAQAAIRPSLNRAFQAIEREMAPVLALDQAALSGTHLRDSTLVEMVAEIAGWAIRDTGHRYFPPAHLQKLYRWVSTMPEQDQRVVLACLTGQLDMQAALLVCAVQPDQPSMQLQQEFAALVQQEFAALVRKDFAALVQTIKGMPPAWQPHAARVPLAVVRAAQANRWPDAGAMRDYLSAEIQLLNQI